MYMWSKAIPAKFEMICPPDTSDEYLAYTLRKKPDHPADYQDLLFSDSDKKPPDLLMVHDKYTGESKQSILLECGDDTEPKYNVEVDPATEIKRSYIRLDRTFKRVQQIMSTSIGISGSKEYEASWKTRIYAINERDHPPGKLLEEYKLLDRSGNGYMQDPNGYNYRSNVHKFGTTVTNRYSFVVDNVARTDQLEAYVPLCRKHKWIMDRSNTKAWKFTVTPSGKIQGTPHIYLSRVPSEPDTIHSRLELLMPTMECSVVFSDLGKDRMGIDMATYEPRDRREYFETRKKFNLAAEKDVKLMDQGSLRAMCTRRLTHPLPLAAKSPGVRLLHALSQLRVNSKEDLTTIYAPHAESVDEEESLPYEVTGDGEIIIKGQASAVYEIGATEAMYNGCCDVRLREIEGRIIMCAKSAKFSPYGYPMGFVVFDFSAPW